MKKLYKPKIKKILSSSTLYVGVSVFNRAISFLLLPVLTRFITPFYYGVLATFQAIYPMGEVFINMGSTTAVTRHNFDMNKTKKSLSEYIFNTLLIKLFFFIIFFGLLVALSRWLINKFSFPFWLIVTIPGLAFVSAFILMITKLWIAEKKVYTYSLFQCSRAVLNIGISILFIAALGLGWKGRVLGIAVVEILFMIICLLFLLRKKLLIFKIKFPIIIEILKFGMPLFVYSACRWVINLTDRFFLNVMTDVSVTGIYSVGYSLSSIVEIIAGGVGFAIMPILFEKLKNPTDLEKITIIKYTYLYFIGLFCITMAWIFIAPFFVKIFVGKNFSQAVIYIPLVSMAYFVSAISRIFSLYITYSKKTYFLTYSVIVAAVVNLILNYVLIKANGPIGAAQSTLISYLVITAIAFIFMQKVYPMPWFSFIRVEKEGL